MPEAILIVGGGLYFKKGAGIFRSFLQNRVGIPDILTIETAYLDHKSFQDRFCKELGRATFGTTPRPILIIYIGHGFPGQWTINEDTGISYDFVAQTLAQVEREVLLINDCCHSLSIGPYLDKFGVSKELVGVIASCRNGQESDRRLKLLPNQIEEAWVRREKIQANVKKASGVCRYCSMLVTKHNPSNWFMQDVGRWGQYFDYHFFPQQQLLPRTTSPL